MPSRRQFLRRLGGSAALGTLVATAGCTAPSVANTSSTRGGRATDRDALTEDEFADYTARMRERYGDAGVWGRGTAPETDGPATPTFLGGWTYPDYTGRWDETRLVDSADFALACYRVGTKGEENEQFYRYWLWGAATPAETATVDTPLGRQSVSPTLRGLGVHVAFDGDDELLTYGPAGERTRQGLISVDSGLPDGDPVAGGFRLRAGTVHPGYPDTWESDPGDNGVGQDADEYTVGWEGSYERTQSVNAVCVTRRPADAAPEVVVLDWAGHVAVAGQL